MWVLLRKNKPCTNKYSKYESIICCIYKGEETFDSHAIEKLKFKKYKDFKLFKDLIIKNRRLPKVKFKKQDAKTIIQPNTLPIKTTTHMRWKYSYTTTD